MSFTNYLENKIVGHVFGGAAFTAPAALYVALFTAAPGETGGGTEVTGGSYARREFAFTVTGSQAANTDLEEWDAATADWGTVTHAGVFDASSAGNLLAYAALTTARNVLNGDIFRVAAGNLTISLD